MASCCRWRRRTRSTIARRTCSSPASRGRRTCSRAACSRATANSARSTRVASASRRSCRRASRPARRSRSRCGRRTCGSARMARRSPTTGSPPASPGAVIRARRRSMNSPCSAAGSRRLSSAPMPATRLAARWMSFCHPRCAGPIPRARMRRWSRRRHPFGRAPFVATAAVSRLNSVQRDERTGGTALEQPGLVCACRLRLSGANRHSSRAGDNGRGDEQHERRLTLAGMSAVRRYRSLQDLKGMKIAMNAPGVSNTSTLNTLLQSAGLKYSDVETVDLPLPDHVAALKNKSVDASASVEPGPALAIRNGDAVLIKSDDEILPNHQIAVLLYSEEFASKRADPARRFMRAYIRAVRFYNGALKNGRLDGANSDDVIAILSEATPIKSRDIYKLITPTGMNPDGRVNKASLAYDLAFYAEQGLIKGAVNLDEAVDGSFVEAVLKELGPYRP